MGGADSRPSQPMAVANNKTHEEQVALVRDIRRQTAALEQSIQAGDMEKACVQYLGQVQRPTLQLLTGIPMAKLNAYEQAKVQNIARDMKALLVETMETCLGIHRYEEKERNAVNHMMSIYEAGDEMSTEEAKVAIGHAKTLLKQNSAKNGDIQSQITGLTAKYKALGTRLQQFSDEFKSKAWWCSVGSVACLVVGVIAVVGVCALAGPAGAWMGGMIGSAGIAEEMALCLGFAVAATATYASAVGVMAVSVAAAEALEDADRVCKMMQAKLQGLGQGLKSAENATTSLEHQFKAIVADNEDEQDMLNYFVGQFKLKRNHDKLATHVERLTELVHCLDDLQRITMQNFKDLVGTEAGMKC